MDGFSATEGIRRRNPLARIVIATVSDDPNIIRRAYEAGVMAYMLLPFSAEEISHVIRAIAGPRPSFPMSSSSADEPPDGKRRLVSR